MIALTQEKREELAKFVKATLNSLNGIEPEDPNQYEDYLPEYIQKCMEIALASLTAETFCWPNGCNESIPNALRYLAENDRPSSGNSSFNTKHLYDMARQFEIATSNRFFTAPPVPAIKLPDDNSCEDGLKKHGLRTKEEGISQLSDGFRCGFAWHEHEIKRLNGSGE